MTTSERPDALTRSSSTRSPDGAQVERVTAMAERILEHEGGLSTRLEQLAELLGRELHATRAMIYGNSAPDDAAIRVRVAWHADGAGDTGEWMPAMPLLAHRPRIGGLVVSTPRAHHCPADCETSLPNCALRGACSTLLEPLRLGADVYGSLALHAVTGRVWQPDERHIVRRVARMVALEIARHRQVLIERELDAGRSSIAMTALHQLSTPVTALGCVLDELARQPTPDGDQLAMLLDVGRHEWQRLRRLCDDIAILVQGDPSATFATCDVVREVAATVEQARWDHPAATIAITVVGEIPSARCSTRSLNRVLAELIENACRYGAGPASIEIVLVRERHGIVVRLRDDGPGLTAAQAHVLGGAFTRLDPDMRHAPGGTGLGLAIVRQLVRRAGGSIDLAPRTDRSGTQVTLVLPAADGDRGFGDEDKERTIVADGVRD